MAKTYRFCARGIFKYVHVDETRDKLRYALISDRRYVVFENYDNGFAKIRYDRK